MVKNIKPTSTHGLWMLSLAVLGVAAWGGYKVLQALAGLAPAADAAVHAQPAWLAALKRAPDLANALPMLAVCACAAVLALLALAVTAWRRHHRRSPAVPAAPVAAAQTLEAPAAAIDLAKRLDAHDALAGLLSREQFLAQHGTQVAQAGQLQQRMAVFCFDLERLASINAMLGFEAGDEAIAQTAQRARSELGPAGVLVRLGGGTLAAWVRGDAAQTGLPRATALRTALQLSVPWRDHMLDLGVTVGCAFSPEHGETPAELLRRAEQALYAAKRLGVVVAAYHPTIEAARLAHLEMASGLRQAMERGELVPHLQPRWCTRSQRIVGAEVLVRWQHPARGLLLPGEFLPFAQANGWMARITPHMLQTAVRLLRQGLPDGRLSVNLAAADLREPGLVPLLQQLLQTQGVAAHRLCLEVAEMSLLTGSEETLARLQALRQLGLDVAIDDFGSGAAPLAQLRHLPANELKLHKSYITDVDINPGRRQLLQSIIEMAHSLNLSVTAKGVETPGERQVLEMLGCDYLQGHLIGRPVPVEAFAGAAPAPAPATPQVPVQDPGAEQAPVGQKASKRSRKAAKPSVRRTSGQRFRPASPG